jgi:hypothetical protein
VRHPTAELQRTLGLELQIASASALRFVAPSVVVLEEDARQLLTKSKAFHHPKMIHRYLDNVLKLLQHFLLIYSSQPTPWVPLLRSRWILLLPLYQLKQPHPPVPKFEPHTHALLMKTMEAPMRAPISIWGVRSMLKRLAYRNKRLYK